jgi:hypothetical protein
MGAPPERERERAPPPEETNAATMGFQNTHVATKEKHAACSDQSTAIYVVCTLAVVLVDILATHRDTCCG